MLIQQEHSSDLVHIARDLESSERKPATDMLVENEMMYVYWKQISLTMFDE